MFGVVLIPQFQLQAVLRHEPEASENPIALIEDQPANSTERKKSRILQMTAPAQAAGVEAGMTATQGQARCPGLRILSRSSRMEANAQVALLQWAETVSPQLESTAPGVCTLDLKGARQLRDQAEAFGQTVIHALGTLNLSARAGVAKTPDLAWLAARFAAPFRRIPDAKKAIDAFLDPLPIKALQISEEIHLVLHRWGLKTMSDLRKLPATELTERLGKEFAEAWERFHSCRTRPLKTYRPPLFLTESIDFEAGIERLEALLFSLNRSLDQLIARLRTLYLVVEELQLELRFENGCRHERVFHIPEPTRNAALLLRGLHTHLENLTAAAPVAGISLSAKPARASQQQLSLFESYPRDPNAFAETLTRLEALLGDGRSGSPLPEQSHRPDTFRMVPFEMPSEAARPPQNEPIPAPAGPSLRRFRPPLPARVTLVDGPDAEASIRVASERLQGRFKRTRGPWRHSGHWWDPCRWEREEWDVELEKGGVYRLAKEKDQWIVDGVYD